jgi:ribonuclease H2 subunit B
VVYRYSPTKVLEYLRIKVARLARPEVFERSRTLIRGLAKDGLMEDGKEDLLEGTVSDFGKLVNLAQPITAGRIRAACDLLGHYLPTDTLRALVASYE